MVAATKYTSILFAVAVQCLAPPAFANADVIEIVRAEAKSSFDKLENRVAECMEQKKVRKINPLDITELQRRQISRKEALTALSYLNQRNSDACDQTERTNFSYSLGVLDSILKEYNVTVPIDIPRAQSGLLYPSHRDYELYLRYMQIPKSTRDYLDQLVGTEPFNVLDVLNNLPDY